MAERFDGGGVLNLPLLITFEVYSLRIAGALHNFAAINGIII
jgi:hypothetical protein